MSFGRAFVAQLGASLPRPRLAPSARRHFSTTRPHQRPGPARRFVPIGLGTTLALTAVYAVGTGDDGAAPSATSARPAIAYASTLELARSYLVWTVLGVPTIVDASPAILDALLHSSIPGLPALAEALIKATFFAQFIPGEDAAGCVPAMEALRRRNVGSALNYSAEADTLDDSSPLDLQEARFDEVERALDVQGAFEQRMAAAGWARGSSAFALKVTGLVDPAVLVRASNTLHRLRAAKGVELGGAVPYPGFPTLHDVPVLHPTSTDLHEYGDLYRRVPAMHLTESEPGLQPGDMQALALLWQRLDRLTERARRNGVRFILDAEESFYEPVLDGYVQMLSMKYNRPEAAVNSVDKVAVPWNGPVVYGSYQSYLQRQPEFLKAQIAHAQAHGYALGIKLVRGGYIVKEHGNWAALGKPGTGPVWPSKPETDASYNGSIETILSTMAAQLGSDRPDLALSVIFGTHNIDSASKIITTLEHTGLASRTVDGKLRLRPDAAGKVSIAQLYGMRDDLGDLITSSFEPSKSPMSMVFIAYGRLRETLPFLGRRAIENKSILTGHGGAADERRRVGAELRKRLTFGLL